MTLPGKCLLPGISMILMFCVTMSSSAAPGWVSVNGNNTQMKPEAHVVKMDATEAIIQFNINGFDVDDITEGADLYHSLRFPYYYTTLEVGKPQLPAITEMIGIPNVANVTLEIMAGEFETLTDYRVHPFQTPLLEGQQRTRLDIDAGVYSRDAFYPGVLAEIDQPSIWRDVRTVTLRVYPLQFNPVTGELNVYRDIMVRLKFDGVSDSNILEPDQQFVSPEYDEMYRHTILNYVHLDLPHESVGNLKRYRQDYDLLIIYVDQFSTEAGNLETWKDNTGIRTEIVALSTISPATAHNIKQYIRGEYEDHHIKWVLLIGDISALPAYTGYPGMISDYWYALLSGSDHINAATTR